MSIPYVSVILAVRNEAPYIARTLEAVLQQDYPREATEIVVADGASDDGTLDVVQSLAGSERVQIISNPQRIQAAGLNLAIQQARGDVIVRVDGHTIIAPDYVSQCVAALTATGAAAVGGRMDSAGITPVGKAIALAGATRFAVPSAFHVSTTPQYTDTVYMGAWPREVLLAIGGFDEGLRTNEDYELNYRIRRSGGRIYLSPAIRSTYLCRQTLPTLAQQYLHYGAGKARMLRMHPASVRARQLVAPAFAAFLICGLALWAITPPIAHPLFLGVLICYSALAVAFSALVALHATGRGDAGRGGFVGVMWRLPLVYLTMHLAWGCGFWWGAVIGAPLRVRPRRHRSEEDVRLPVAAEALGLEDRHGL